jgi:formylglycine-generating enzyme required for sulfatase activity
MLAALLFSCSTSPTCPAEMALVSGRAGPFCIQRYEAALSGDPGPRSQAAQFPGHAAGAVQLSAAAGQVPSNAVSWYQSRAACLAVGLHLCTSAEWEDACAGPPGQARREYPIEGGRLWDRCYVGRPGGGVMASGGAPGCATPEGVYDLAGNLWEWTDPGQLGPDGSPLIDKRGGGYYTVDGVPCAREAVGTHAPDFDGTIGFRCCAPVSR